MFCGNNFILRTTVKSPKIHFSTMCSNQITNYKFPNRRWLIQDFRTEGAEKLIYYLNIFFWKPTEILKSCMYELILAVRITSNDRSFGCPIIYKDFNSQYYFVHRHLDNACYNKANCLIGKPNLAIIASNVSSI